ncbi:FkbM family methyltransferase [Campylobacter coli]|nr:FkbM family methyltransferase [Campylobacter coli]
MNKIKKYLFKIFRFLPLSKNKIVFIAHSASRFDCNPKAIFEELLKNKAKVKYVWILNKKFHKEYKDKYPMVSFVSPSSFKAFFHLSTCRVFINNQIHVYYKKMGFNKRPEQLYLQTWHGSFGMKRINIVDEVEKVFQASQDMDYWITNSFFESEVYKKYLWANRVLEIGHARSDILFNSDYKGRVKEKYNLSKDCKLVLYAPTKKEQYSQLNCAEVVAKFSDKVLKIFKQKYPKHTWYILIRRHAYDKGIVKYQNQNIIDAFDYPDVMELVKECDVLISDYSSIICDFALTYKPIFIYANDYDSFILTSKLYHDYSKLPFSLAKNFDELEKCIINFDHDIYKQGLKVWLESVGCIENGEASKKISSLITQFIEKDRDLNLYTTNQVTPYIAKIMGFKNIYFTFRNIGDQIIMMRSLELLHQKTKQIFLIGTTLPDLWKEVKFVKVVNLKEIKLHIYQKEQFDLMASYGIKPIFLTQESFNKEKGKYIRTYGPSHIVANVCSKLGLEGDIVVDLNFPLSEKEKTFGRFASENKKQIAIISGGLQRYKTYPFEKLQEVVNSLQEKYDFIQIGTEEDLPLRGALDLREKLTLREVASTLYNSDLFVGGIGGLMHMANAVGCPSVVLYSEAEPEYIVNYNNNINVFPVDNTCVKCTEGKHCPWNSPCKAEDQKYSCIDNIQIEDVVQAINKRIELPRNLNKPTIYHIKQKKVYGLEEYKKIGFSFVKENQYFGIGNVKNKTKKALQVLFFGYSPISFVYSRSYFKIRILNLHINLSRFIVKTNNKKQVPQNQHSKNGLNDNFMNRIIKIKNHLKTRDWFLINELVQNTNIKNQGKFIELLNKEKYIDHITKPVGKKEINQKVYEIFLYDGFILPFKIAYKFYVLEKKCYINTKRKKEYIQQGDIIDIGGGLGLTTCFLSRYTNNTVYSLEPSFRLYMLLNEICLLNQIENIKIFNLACSDSNDSLYTTNKLDNSNKVGREKLANVTGVKATTLDSFVLKYNVQPKFINIWNNGYEFESLIGMTKTIQQFRPIIHINISNSIDKLFDIFDFLIFHDYSIDIKRAAISNNKEFFVLCEPR